MEPVRGGGAMPPATGQGDVEEQVLQLVKALPWWDRAKQLGLKSFQLTRYDADLVQGAICAAINDEGISLELAKKIACQALAEAQKNLVQYVAGAFHPRRLKVQLARLEIIPPAEDPLPLPQLSTLKPKAAEKVQPQPAANAESGERLRLVSCSTCDAREGEGLHARFIPDDEGRLRPCPACNPKANSQLAQPV